MALPYMPLYVADYLGDTQHLTCEQDGAYLRLLMCLWRSGGKLPLDHAKLARMCKLSPRKWAAVWVDLEPFFDVSDGMISSARLAREIEEADRNFAEKSSLGVASGKSRVLKSLKSGRTTSPSESTSEDLFKNPTPPTETRLSVPEAARQAWDATPQLCRKRSSLGQLTKALEAAVNRRKNLAVIVQAVAAYYDDPEKAREGHRYARGVHRVIQDDYWETWAATEVEHLPPPEIRYPQFRNWMKEFLTDPSQWRPERGPRPDEPRCLIPPEIMAEFGYTPPFRRAV